MRTWIATIAGISLLTIALFAQIAFADSSDVPQRQRAAKIEQAIFFEQAHPTLIESPYYQEIRHANEAAAETEQLLLARLQDTSDEEEFSRIVHRLERLEVERELKVLRIQARYAHGAGMLDLEMKIRSRILHILETDSSR